MNLICSNWDKYSLLYVYINHKPNYYIILEKLSKNKYKNSKISMNILTNP